VIVTSVSTGGSGGEDRLTENVTLNFATVQVSYQPQATEGAAPEGGDHGHGLEHRREQQRPLISTARGPTPHGSSGHAG
jgi:type VI secretion system secreted protein Hcp